MIWLPKNCDHWRKHQNWRVHYSLNINQLQRNHKSIGNVIIRWEPLDRKRKRFTQCFRCQAWGHSAQNCGRPRHCVKCLEDHEPGKCSRINKEAPGNPQCWNCKGDHAANSRECPTFAEYERNMLKLRNNHQPQRRASPLMDHEDFPALTKTQQDVVKFNQKKGVSFAGITRQTAKFPDKSSHSQSDSQILNLESSQANFRGIPNINETMKLFDKMNTELINASTQGERISILLKYTTLNDAP